MKHEEMARILTTITAEQWETILSISDIFSTFSISSIPSIPVEHTDSPVIEQDEQVVEENLPKERSEDELYVRVFDILKEMGVPPHILGYKYLHEAIILTYGNEAYVHNITKWLYPELAKRFNTTSTRVERAIRHGIHIAFDRGDYDVHEKIFKGVYSPLRGVPTNSECIAILAEYIRYN